MSWDQHPVDTLQEKTDSIDTSLLHPPESLAPLETKPNLWDSIGSAVRELVETLLLTLVIFLLIRFAMQNFRVEGFSMEPNFHDGQFLLVTKIEYMLHSPERGDVIVFRFPNQPSRDFIKRIIGLPGDRIDIRNGQVLVNNESLPESYPLNAGSYTYGPVTVGAEEYFVLGDNRNNSSDSHSWGMLPTKNIIGKAWFSYWPPQWVGLVPHFTYAAAQ
jgi:signal peptidase I